MGRKNSPGSQRSGPHVVSTQSGWDVSMPLPANSTLPQRICLKMQHDLPQPPPSFSFVSCRKGAQLAQMKLWHDYWKATWCQYPKSSWRLTKSNWTGELCGNLETSFSPTERLSLVLRKLLHLTTTGGAKLGWSHSISKGVFLFWCGKTIGCILRLFGHQVMWCEGRKEVSTLVASFLVSFELRGEQWFEQNAMPTHLWTDFAWLPILTTPIISLAMLLRIRHHWTESKIEPTGW